MSNERRTVAEALREEVEAIINGTLPFVLHIADHQTDQKAIRSISNLKPFDMLQFSLRAVAQATDQLMDEEHKPS